MKTDIHPTYAEATIVCSCGNTVSTRSTKSDLHVEICSNCHPFYTGKQKFLDTGGRMGRFAAKLEAAAGEAPAKKGKKANVRTFTPAVDPKIMAAKAARAEAKALEDAKRRKEAEEAAEREAQEAAAAKAAEAEAATAPAEEAASDEPAAATDAPVEDAPAADEAPADEAPATDEA